MTTTTSLPPAFVYASRFRCSEREAVNPECAENTHAMAESYYGKGTVTKLQDSSQLAKLPQDGKGVLYIPGGHLLMLQMDMMKQAEHVKSFVANGGGIDGADSGGTILCNRVTFYDAEEPLTTSASLFSFLPLEVICPLQDSHLVALQAGSAACEAIVMDSKLGRMCTYVKGSGYLNILDRSKGVKLTAKFLTAPSCGEKIAAARGLYGKGRVAVAQYRVELDPRKEAKPAKEECKAGAGEKKPALRTTDRDRTLCELSFRERADYLIQKA